MKGIILAGGNGTRLNPVTISFTKQLLPIYDKPLIYYPLSTLMNLCITEILIICKTNQLKNFQNLLGNGNKFGLKIEYRIQDEPRGIAEALIIGEDFIKDHPVALILGDNIFYGHKMEDNITKFSRKENAKIFLYKVKNPHQYGVANFKKNKLSIIVEKPKNPLSNFAVTGLYFYNKGVSKYAKKLRPSKRGELEITDLNNIYIKENKMSYIELSQMSIWFDAGTTSDLLSASEYIKAIQKRNNILISCPEEIAYKKKFINKKKFIKLSKNNINNDYYNYLRKQTKI